MNDNSADMTTDAVSEAKNKLVNAPLVLALAQVRFAAVLSVAQAIPAIQEKLKHAGFPRYEKSEAQSIFFGSETGPRVETVERWEFLSRDKRTAVALTSQSVALHTNDYDTFQKFSESLRQIFDIVSAQVDIQIVDRLGIRYVDLVRLEAGESFANYLKPGLVGFPFSEVLASELGKVFSSTHSIAELPNSVLSVRCLQSNTGAFLPPDLIPSTLLYNLTLKPGELVAILDFDHYMTVDIDFMPERLVRSLDELHSLANKAFRAALNPFAYRKWGGNVG